MNPNIPPQGYQQSPQQFYQGATNPTGSAPMMWFSASNPNTAWLMGILWFVTWILVIAVLVALFRLL